MENTPDHTVGVASGYVDDFSIGQETDWTNWKWQQRKSIKNVEQLFSELPNIPIENVRLNASNRKIQITPYYLELIKKSISNNGHMRLLNQVIPYWESELEDGYNGHTENWELSHEMKTPICQHKYDNRVIIRLANICNAYCQFCFEALRTINTEDQKATFNRQHWSETLEYIQGEDELEEVIFSGGEPLMLSDKKLRDCLNDVRKVRPDILIRIHSRTLTFNPYRITDYLLESFKESNVAAFGVHVCHPDEITEEFISAVQNVHEVIPIVFANIPVLKGINDDYETLCNLFFKLYRNGIVPYYLYHFMPFSPGSSEYRASVRDIIGIMQRIKRRKSNIAVPEYVLPHMQGKFTVPLITEKEDYPEFVDLEDGSSAYRFKNWLGQTHDWREG